MKAFVMSLTFIAESLSDLREVYEEIERTGALQGAPFLEQDTKPATRRQIALAHKLEILPQ